MNKNYELTPWKEGPPPYDGVWNIKVDGAEYFAKYQHKQWSSGYVKINKAKAAEFEPYPYNNNPLTDIKWRGRIAKK